MFLSCFIRPSKKTTLFTRAVCMPTPINPRRRHNEHCFTAGRHGKGSPSIKPTSSQFVESACGVSSLEQCLYIYVFSNNFVKCKLANFLNLSRLIKERTFSNNFGKITSISTTVVFTSIFEEERECLWPS